MSPSEWWRPVVDVLNALLPGGLFTAFCLWAVDWRKALPILRALAISSQTSGNVVIMEAIKKVANFVKEGATLSVPLEQTASGRGTRKL